MFFSIFSPLTMTDSPAFYIIPLISFSVPPYQSQLRMRMTLELSLLTPIFQQTGAERAGGAQCCQRCSFCSESSIRPEELLCPCARADSVPSPGVSSSLSSLCQEHLCTFLCKYSSYDGTKIPFMFVSKLDLP